MINSTKDLIKILPFDLKFKQQLLEKYDSLNEDQKYNIDTALWDMYDALYAVRLEQNLQIALEKVKIGEEKLDSELYERVYQLTEKELMEQEVFKATESDLSDTRTKLQEIITHDTQDTTN